MRFMQDPSHLEAHARRPSCKAFWRLVATVSVGHRLWLMGQRPGDGRPPPSTKGLGMPFRWGWRGGPSPHQPDPCFGLTRPCASPSSSVVSAVAQSGRVTGNSSSVSSSSACPEPMPSSSGRPAALSSLSEAKPSGPTTQGAATTGPTEGQLRGWEATESATARRPTLGAAAVGPATWR